MLKFSFRQQVLAGFIISVILVFIVGILSYRSINQLEGDTIAVDHTQRVIKTSTNLLQQMIDAETGVRGYVATNNKIFLDPYRQALPRINTDLEQLKSLMQDNPLQVRRADSLTSYVTEQLTILKENIDTRAGKGLSFMVDNNMLLNGKRNMDQIRLLNEHLIATEGNLLTERKNSSQVATGHALVIIISGSIVFFVIIVVLFLYIQGTFQQQKRVEEKIKLTNIQLEEVLAENEAKNWLLTGTGILNEKMQGQQSEKELAESILAEVCNYTKALAGTFYLYNENDQCLHLCSTFAFHNLNEANKTVKLSEGWIGQVAQNKKPAVLKGNLNDKLGLYTSVLQQQVAQSFIVPFFFEKQLKGVIELAFKDDLDKNNSAFILAIADDIGVAVNTAQARSIMYDLLAEVRQQSEELEAQQEEMRVTNEELVNKTELLQASEEELRVQQDELRNTNVELEEKASLLEEKNQAIEEARLAINNKVKELETTGKYKSEFLANMSHELRTPLNSILVLAQILKENKPGTLSEDQIRYASVIFNAGNDLLTLINDILDLSKIESGKLEMQNDEVKIADILNDMEMLFKEVATNKKINFSTSIDSVVKKQIYTDKVRVEQVIKNLLSNAFKFTPENGSVSINVNPGNKDTVNFCIKDSGIGIPHDKQQVIFEAFQQADGSTSRKYGGTGLGLSISREMAALLGGSINLTSNPGEGSEFILSIPVRAAQPAVVNDQIISSPQTFNKVPAFLKPAQQIQKPGNAEPLVIIVEDDKNFADILQEYARDHGYKSMVVNEGHNAVEIIKDNQPDAVILDIVLSGKDGWQILKELKQDHATMHIPVHLMSAGETAANRVHREGAISFLKKPVNTETLSKLFADIVQQNGRKLREVLLVEDHKEQSNALKELMQNQDISLDQAFDGESAYRMLHTHDYQCVILDLNLPDMSGLDLLDRIKSVSRFKELPVIINTAMEMDKGTVSRLMQYANAMVVKTNKSADRLIDEVNLFLNKITELSNHQNSISQRAKTKIVTSGRDAIKGKRVLIADDDLRNVFALTSALQSYDMIVEVANNGEEAITRLRENKDIDIVLMDIMMPVMDGYEATRQIRSEPRWARVPIIALTAKAMKDDREKCIAAGANDYITKPVDMERLISLMQLWLEV